MLSPAFVAGPIRGTLRCCGASAPGWLIALRKSFELTLPPVTPRGSMQRQMTLRRPATAFLAAMALGVALSVAWMSGAVAGENDLPELGSPANAAISLEDEYGAGLMMVRQLREAGLIL